MSRSIPPNTVIGEYRLVEQIGAGGMGEVYRAVHSKIGRIVALKVLNQTVKSPEFVERFLNEARIQASLQHANIATLYDFFEFNGQPCIIMEYVEGQTLSERIAARGVLPLDEAITIFKSIVDAINCVHAQGIVHRDIKSNNVKISNSGQVKLLDFGIAKSGSSPALTMTGGFVGTLQYLSPEQFTGGIADARSDIWALGVLLYEMVTGRMPFEAETIGSLYEKINAAAFTPPSMFSRAVPGEVEMIISRCLRKNPAERYQSAWELLQDLNRVGTGPSTQPNVPQVTAPTYYQPASGPYSPAPSPSSPYYNPSPALAQGQAGSAKSSKALPIALGAAFVVLVLVAAGAYSFLGSGENGSPSPRPSPSAQPVPTRGGGNPAQSRTVTIDVAEGRADVYKDGQKVGSTPYQFETYPGQGASFVLKRDGYVDKPVEFSATDNRKVYTFMMEKKP